MEEEKRIGVYVCWCGSNIAKMVDVEGVAKVIGSLPNVVVAKDYKYMCSDPGQDLIYNDIKEHNLNRIVVASCSPRMHELTFRKVLEKAGINSYMFQMANIREQCSWVHTDYVEATKKAKALVRASVNRVVHHEALEKRFVDVNPATLVIGGGISGLSAALEIADSGKEVFLVEKTGSLGGHISNIDLTFPYMHSARQMLAPKVQNVQNHPNIKLFLETEVKDISGYVGNFETILTSKDGKDVELKFGNIVVATGLKTFDPSVIKDYGYGKFPDVITSVEFEKMLLDGKILTKEGNEPKNIAIIHCVGSRNKDYHEYCSRVCCMTALKYSNQIRSALPEANIYEAYADMRSFGKDCEEFYLQTSRKDVMFMMFDKQDPPKIKEAGSRDKCKLLVELNEKLCGTSVEVPADMVILMVAMEAYDNVTDISHAVGISMCGNDFYIEKHPKLDPVATTTDGVYIAGTCQGPKDIPDSVAQARAAAARILATIAVGSVEIEPTTAIVNEDICCGCQTCIKVCPYTAISFDEEEGVSVVNEALCKGCGTCGSACPTGAIRTKHFTDQQILSQIEGLMSKLIELQEV